jgi:hypothetical protein
MDGDRSVASDPSLVAPVERPSIDHDAIATGWWVQARVGNERLWFEVIGRVENNAFLCRLASHSVTGVTFDGRCTLDRDWIMQARPPRKGPPLQMVQQEQDDGA